MILGRRIAERGKVQLSNADILDEKAAVITWRKGPERPFRSAADLIRELMLKSVQGSRNANAERAAGFIAGAAVATGAFALGSYQSSATRPS